MRPLAAWAAKRGLMRDGFDKLEGSRRASAVARRKLTADEAGELLRSLGDRAHDRAAKFMLLTAARRDEVCSAAWSEFDLVRATWTIPGGRRKNTRGPSAKTTQDDHVVPLSRQALELLQETNAALVFPGERGERLQNWSRWTRRFAKRTGLTVTPHSLRRTAATLLGELGFAPHVVSAVLGHHAIGGSLHAGYNQSPYRREAGEALQELADFLDALAIGKGDIVPLRA
jgi:integrase